jgi:hypothetical protein
MMQRISRTSAAFRAGTQGREATAKRPSIKSGEEVLVSLTRHRRFW